MPARALQHLGAYAHTRVVDLDRQAVIAQHGIGHLAHGYAAEVLDHQCLHGLVVSQLIFSVQVAGSGSQTLCDGWKPYSVRNASMQKIGGDASPGTS